MDVKNRGNFSDDRPPDDEIHRAYGVRVVLFFVLVVIVAAALFLIYQFTQTLYQLHIAEGERDRWQRPEDVIDSLKLKGGDTVADAGCGVGYFSLKLAPKVAGHGSASSHIGPYVSRASLRGPTRCARSWTSVIPRRVSRNPDAAISNRCFTSRRRDSPKRF